MAHIQNMPFVSPNDDTVLISKWKFPEGSYVQNSAIICEIETTKATIDVAAESSGYLYPLVEEGTSVPVGTSIAIIKESKDEDVSSLLQSLRSNEEPSKKMITRKAEILAKKHNLDINMLLQKYERVTESVVLQEIKSKNRTDSVQKPVFSLTEIPDLTDSERELAQTLRSLHLKSSQSMRELHNRSLPFIEFIETRWERAQRENFSKGCSIYQNVYVFGDVSIGPNTWVGPFSILDGSGGRLRIGSYCSIGAGTHIYTHNSIEWALSAGKSPYLKRSTTIGNNCFIGPQSIISPGVTIGNHCFIGANSFIDQSVPDNSFVSGSPGRIRGKVEVDDDGHIRIRLE